jgi:glycosyltransferase involved in cell wall biosynthesis
MREASAAQAIRMSSVPSPARTGNGASTVLVLMDSASVSGPVRQLAAVVQPLLQSGFHLHCVVFHRVGQPPVSSAAFLAKAGAEVTTLTDSGRFDRALPSKVLRLIRTSGARIVETHGYRPSIIMAMLRRTGQLTVPWIGFFHGRTSESLTIKLYDKLDHLALRAANLVVVMSQLQRREKRTYRTPVHVLMNAAIHSAASSRGDPPESVSNALRPRVGVIGRLSPEKGVDVMLRAWALLVERGVKGTLVVVGDGQERRTLEREHAPLIAAGRVVFVGHLTETGPIYPALDLVVIPSRTEGLPNVFIEALSHNLPVASTRVGAIPDLVGDTEVAWLSAIDDPMALADAVHAALTAAPSDARDAARRHVLESLSLDTRVAALALMYDGLLPAPLAASR